MKEIEDCEGPKISFLNREPRPAIKLGLVFRYCSTCKKHDFGGPDNLCDDDYVTLSDPSMDDVSYAIHGKSYSDYFMDTKIPDNDVFTKVDGKFVSNLDK